MSEEIKESTVLGFSQMILIDTERCDGSWKYISEYQENVRHKRFNGNFFIVSCLLQFVS